MIHPDKCTYLIVDVQGKLAELMHEKEALFANLRRLISGTRLLKIPQIWVEQIPDKMGPTVQPVKELLTDITPVCKSSFSCCLDENFIRRLKDTGKKQIILSGIETHVCIYQTAMDLIKLGYEVEVVADAVSSRTAANKAIGLDRIKTAGAGITCVETLLLEMLRTADHPLFRDVLKLIK